MFKEGDLVECVNVAVAWAQPAHACWAIVTKVTKAYVYVMNEHKNADKYHANGKSIGGGHYAIRPAPKG